MRSGRSINPPPLALGFHFFHFPRNSNLTSFPSLEIQNACFGLRLQTSSLIRRRLLVLQKQFKPLLDLTQVLTQSTFQMNFHYRPFFFFSKNPDFHLQRAGSGGGWGPFCLFDYEMCRFDCLVGEQHLLYWLRAWQTHHPNSLLWHCLSDGCRKVPQSFYFRKWTLSLCEEFAAVFTPLTV